MQLDEIVAEKLRALAQRVRPTDLSDLVMVLARDEIDAGHVRTLTARKFELVKEGDRRARIETNIAAMAPVYNAAVAAVAPDAPDYRSASTAVLARLSVLLP